MRVKFGDVVKDVKENVDRSNNPYEFYVAGDHMDSEDFRIHRFGRFATDDVGPAFVRIFHPGQILYGSRRTYLKKVCVADFEGVTANTTFVLETKDENVLLQKLLPFLMLSKGFADWSIKHSKGSTNPYVLFSDLADYEFDLPPLDRQKELAELLWAANDLKESYKKMIAATDEMLKAKFREMFGECGVKECAISNSRQTARFDEVLYDDTKSATKIPAGEYLDAGNTAIFDQATDSQIAGYSNVEVGVNYDFPALLFGDHSRVIKYVDRPFFIGADGVKILRIKDGKYVPEFAYYMLAHYAIPGTGYNRHFKWLKGGLYILPPLALQQQFVEIARKADETKAALKKSIADIDQVIKGLING